MISSDSQGNLSKHAVYLAAGIGIGMAAVVAHKMVMGKANTKKEITKKTSENGQQGAEPVNKNQIDTDFFDKEQNYQQRKQMNLTNLVKKSQKTVKGRGGKDMLNEYMENAEVMIARINKLQTMYPGTPVYPNPLLYDSDVPESLKSKIQKFGNENGADGSEK